MTDADRRRLHALIDMTETVGWKHLCDDLLEQIEGVRSVESCETHEDLIRAKERINALSFVLATREHALRVLNQAESDDGPEEGKP